MNKSAVSGISGKLKIWTIIIGAVVVGLLANASNYKTIKEHEVYFGSSVACLVISAVFIIGALIGIMDGHDLFKKFDMVFHLIASLLLIASGIVFVIHVDNQGNCRGNCKDLFAQKMSAGALGLLNGVIYGYISWILY